ncbi:MAG: hypothetical protein QG656_915 [Candidatus Hydrogenedentes bacterium]|nr:hypothetical protein [Candidatus Hydrogenedentota bacterium]
MLKKRVLFQSGVVLLLACSLTACSHLMWWRDKAPDEGQAVEEMQAVEPQPQDYEGALKNTVNALIARAPESAGDAEGQFMRRKPYFYKEYSVYPGGADAFTTLVTKTESRTAPYLASVKLDKVRFSTRFHRKKDEARADSNYLRDTGSETLTYEYRNGEWVLLGSFFVADKTEENVNGEWVAVQEQVQRTVAAEEPQKKGWFGRMWSKITGRD